MKHFLHLQGTVSKPLTYITSFNPLTSEIVVIIALLLLRKPRPRMMAFLSSHKLAELGAQIYLNICHYAKYTASSSIKYLTNVLHF